MAQGAATATGGCNASPTGAHGRPQPPSPPGPPPLALEGTPADGVGAGARSLDEQGHCMGALRAQLRTSATRRASDPEVRVDPLNQVGAALASLGSRSSCSASSSRRPSNEPRRPSCSSCASDALSDATLPGEAASPGSGQACPVITTGVGLQEIHNVLHGMMLELRELRAAQKGDK